MSKKKSIEEWLGEELAEYSMKGKLAPRAIEDKLDECTKLSETKEEFYACASGLLQGEEPEDILRKYRLAKPR